MTAAVEATGVGKRYGSLVAVEDLTFTVEAGEILGVRRDISLVQGDHARIHSRFISVFYGDDGQRTLGR